MKRRKGTRKENGREEVNPLFSKSTVTSVRITCIGPLPHHIECFSSFSSSSLSANVYTLMVSLPPQICQAVALHERNSGTR